MEPEAYFLRYAMPCAFIIRDLGEISDSELDELEEAAVSGKKLHRERLEKVFYRGFEKLKRFAGLGDPWDIEIIRKYFHEQHNREIEKREGYYADCGEMQRELSKVRKAVIKEVRGMFYIVEFGQQKRNVFSKLVPGLGLGDGVIIHFFFAVEKA